MVQDFLVISQIGAKNHGKFGAHHGTKIEVYFINFRGRGLSYHITKIGAENIVKNLEPRTVLNKKKIVLALVFLIIPSLERKT